MAGLIDIMDQLKLETPMDLLPLLHEEAQNHGIPLRLDNNSDGIPYLFSVIDVIRSLCKCNAQEAAQKYSNLDDSVKIDVHSDHQFPGERQRPTPAATPLQLIKIIQALDGTRYPLVGQFKKMCNEILVHVGGANPALGHAILAQNEAFNRGDVPIDAPIQAFRLESATLMPESMLFSNNIRHTPIPQSAIELEERKLSLEERRLALEERKINVMHNHINATINTGKTAIENMRNVNN